MAETSDRGAAKTQLGRHLEDRNMSIAGLISRIEIASGGDLAPDTSLVWRWVNGHVRPGSRYLNVIALILKLDAIHLGHQIEQDYLRVRAQIKPNKSEIGSPSGLPPGQDDHDDGTSDLRHAHGLIDRRTVLEMLLASAAAGPILDLSHAASSIRLSSGALEGLSLVTNHLGTSFDRYDFAELGRQLALHLNFVTRYLNGSATVKQRTELCFHGSRLAGLSAGLAFLTGQVERASICYDTAFRLADEIGDKPMMTWSIAEEAAMLSHLGRRLDATKMLQRLPKIHDACQRANAASTGAWTFSRTGDKTLAHAALAEAEQSCLQIPSELDSSLTGPMWSFSQISGFTLISESWLNLGNPRNALVTAHRALELGANQEGPRFGANARMVMAVAHATLGEAELACAMASEVFASFPQDFFIIEGRARALFQALASTRNCGEVTRLREEFAHYISLSNARARDNDADAPSL